MIAKHLVLSKFKMETLLRIFTYTTNEMHISLINTTAGNNAKRFYQTKNGIL